MPVPKLMARSPLYDSMSCAVSGNRIRLARQLIGGFREGFRIPRIGMQVAGRDHWHGCSDQAPFLMAASPLINFRLSAASFVGLFSGG